MPANDILNRLVSAIWQLLRMARGPYRVTPMLPQYANEEIPGNTVWPGSAVVYLTTAQRAAFALTFRDSRIYDAVGALYDTSGAESLFSDDRAIFVMDADGNFFASKEQRIGEFHHSSLAAGGPVAAAGELQVSQGVLILLSDKSGHYQPARQFTAQAIDRLKENHIFCRRVTLDLISQR